MGSGALYRQEQKESLGPLRIHTRDLIAKVIAKVILRLAYSGVTERTIGKRVFFFYFLVVFVAFFWPISILLCSLALMYFDMYLCYVMVISVLIFSVA